MARRWTCPVNLAQRDEEFRQHTHEWVNGVCKRCRAKEPGQRGTT